VRKDLQQIARDALGEHKGSVVALDPRDGSILAMWSYPAYDPNPLASHDLAAAQAAKDLLDADPDHPLRGRTWQERFFPGSTFKLVTGSIGVDTGKVTQSDPSFPALSAYEPPDGKPIGNFGGEVCGGALFNILAVSCNSSFAQMGAEVVGPGDMQAGAARFGFNSAPPIDLPSAVRSVFPDTGKSKALLGQASIGQFNTAATPLEMAMVAGAIGNGGQMMAPHVMKEVRDSKGNVVKTYAPSLWHRVMSQGSSDLMKQAMEGVVAHGTGTAAQISGMEVGGKTGTAQLGTTPPSSHAWFVCYAGPPGEAPQIAVAVLVEGEPGASETTGGTVAAPIARQIVEQALGLTSPGG
jgi:peptidoglycan glycosyltransferase